MQGMSAKNLKRFILEKGISLLKLNVFSLKIMSSLKIITQVAKKNNKSDSNS